MTDKTRPAAENGRSLLIPPASCEELTRLLMAEADLIDGQCHAVIRQRSGVAASDAKLVVRATEDLERLHAELNLTRTRRDALLGPLEAPSLGVLAELCGGTLPMGLERARQELRSVAERLQQELRINRTVLRRALDSGDTFLRRIVRTEAPPPDYDPCRPGTRSTPSLLVNKVV